MSSGDPKYSFTLIDSAGNSRPLNLVDGIATAPAEEGSYKLYASYTEYGTTYYSNGVDFTVKKPDPYWFYFGDTKTLVLKSGPDVPAGYGATVTGSGKIPESLASWTDYYVHGKCNGWEAYRSEMVKAVVADNITVQVNMSEWFYSAGKLVALEGFEKLDTSKVSEMREVFSSCSSLEDISGLATWNTSNVTNMGNIFAYCKALKDISVLAAWNTENLELAYGMFCGCTSLVSLSGLERWKTGKVTQMDGMFNGCSSLKNISALSGWNTQNVKFMMNMFSDCSALEDISALADWNTSSVTDLHETFSYCSKVTNWAVLNGWTVSKNAYNLGTFVGCTQPLPSWAPTD